MDSSVGECLWTFELKSNNTLHLSEIFHLRFSKHYIWIEGQETICQISDNQRQNWEQLQIPLANRQNCFPQHAHPESNITVT